MSAHWPCQGHTLQCRLMKILFIALFFANSIQIAGMSHRAFSTVLEMHRS